MKTILLFMQLALIAIIPFQATAALPEAGVPKQLAIERKA